MKYERQYLIPKSEIRHLDITNLERIQRFKRAGYGGSVSDSLSKLGVWNTVLSQKFRPLRQDMVICGEALPVKLHTTYLDEYEIQTETDSFNKRTEEQFAAQGGHPQKRMMRKVEEKEDGCILCFDCGGDMQPAHFGEMSCQVAKAHGCKGMLIAGNCRDTQYVLKMDDFPMFTFGTAPNAFGGWIVTDVDVPILMPGHLTHYVTVFPGDFIFGDLDGVQVIPREVVDEVLLRVEAIFEKENRQRELLAAGMPVDEVYRRFGVL